MLPGLLLFSVLPLFAATAGPDAGAIVRAAIDHWRGLSSYSVNEIRISRPDWERAMTMRVWTKGDERSLVRVVSPAKDAGSANLLVEGEMWSFSPKVSRVVKIPSSMMEQSWMGSDFTNNDLAKADDLLDYYDLKLAGVSERDGLKVYTIDALPREDAPVVWGRERLAIREDYLVLEHTFFDQDGTALKRLESQEIRELGGRLVVSRERMSRLDRPGEWTEVRVLEAAFGLDVPDAFFTLQSLRNPRAP